MEIDQPNMCPKCNISAGLKKIAYGYFGRPSLLKTIRNSLFGPEKDYILGGCVIEDDSPAWYCNKCEHRWGNINFNTSQ